MVILSQCVWLHSSQAVHNWNSSHIQTGAFSPLPFLSAPRSHSNLKDVREVVGDLPGESSLAEEIVATFETILGETIFAKRVF